MELPLPQWGSVFLTNPHWYRRVSTEDHRTGEQQGISVGKGAALGVWYWQLLETRPCCFFCLTEPNKPSVGNHQLSWSASTQRNPLTRNHWCYDHLLSPPILNATKVFRTSRSSGWGSTHSTPQQRSRSWPHSVYNELVWKSMQKIYTDSPKPL